jgi:N-acetylmuramoyl-L-alanine amidase
VSEIQLEAVERLTEEEILILTLHGECRGEPYFGQVAVGCVIRNRVVDKRWPNSYKEICLQPKQFSFWNQTLPLSHLQAILGLEATKVLRCLAMSLMTWMIPDVTGGANHYINAFARPAEPGWAQNTKQIVMWPSPLIGVHTFYRL